jgi:hypothetical protein
MELLFIIFQEERFLSRWDLWRHFPFPVRYPFCWDCLLCLVTVAPNLEENAHVEGDNIRKRMTSTLSIVQIQDSTAHQSCSIYRHKHRLVLQVIVLCRTTWTGASEQKAEACLSARFGYLESMDNNNINNNNNNSLQVILFPNCNSCLSHAGLNLGFHFMKWV